MENVWSPTRRPREDRDVTFQDRFDVLHAAWPSPDGISFQPHPPPVDNSGDDDLPLPGDFLKMEFGEDENEEGKYKLFFNLGIYFFNSNKYKVFFYLDISFFN